MTDTKSRDSAKPPRIAEKILSLLHSGRGSSTHLGDFAEVYAEVAAERGPAAARFWYGSQILVSIPGFLAARFYWSAVMFRNYLVIFSRNFIRDKGITVLNLAGLAAGMTCFFLILSYVRFETGYDRFHEKADRIYRILAGSEARRSELNTSTPDILAAALPSHIPGIVRAALIYPDYGPCILADGEKSFSQKGLFADPDFLDIFSFPAIRGDGRSALSAPSSIVLTESTARKLFGPENPLGKLVVRKSMGARRELTVTAVLRDIPPNSHLRFDYLASLETLRADASASEMFGSWDVSYFTTYVELAPGQTRESAERLIPAMMSKVSADKDRSFLKFSFQPLIDIHLRSGSISGESSGGDIRSVRLFLTIALLILIIACFNHVNLATAQAAVRAREIGIRKVTGAQRTQIFRQFLAESFSIASLAGLLAFGLVVLVLQRFETLFGVPVRLSSLGLSGFWPWFPVTVGLVGLTAGLYPAFVLSAVPPVRTLRESAPVGIKGAFLRDCLVVFQFAASVVLIMITMIVFGQMKYVKSERLGYTREHVVVIPAREKETMQKLSAIKSALEERSEVVSASLSGSLPTQLGIRYYGVELDKDDGTKVKLDFDAGYVDENFLDVYEIGLRSGRNFRRGDRNVMLINEAAVNEFGWKNPLGKKFRGGPVEIVGVFKDFHNGSLHKKIGPMVLFYGSGGAQISVRVRPGDLARTIGVLRSVFERKNPGQPFDFYFLDDTYNALYIKEIRTGRIFGAFAGLAVLLTCLGIFGLTSFNVSRRKKEIGIRRVLGASVSGLVLWLNRDFVRLIVIGNLLAWPLAFVGMNRWLENFSYRISVRPWIFILSSLLSLGVALLVVGGRTVKAASANPSKTIRHE